MRFPPLAALTTLLGAIILAGCCANDTCDCQDELEDAIRLQFKTPIGDDLTGFSKEELDTIRVLRTRLPSPATPANTKFPSDTVVIIRPTVRADGPIYIANNTPFAISGTLRINAYKYTVLVPQNRRKKFRVYQSYKLKDIQLRGGYEPDGCCTCYRNTERRATLTYTPIGARASDSVSTSYDRNVDKEILLPRK